MTAPWIAAFACLWLVVLLVGFGVVGVMRRLTGILERAERHLASEPPGAPLLTVIPPFELFDELDDAVSSTDVILEPSIVLLMEEGCEPCRSLAVELRDADLGRVPLIVIAGEHG